MTRKPLTTIAIGLIALASMITYSLAEPAPRSLFGEIAETAPRSVFDQIAETAPRSIFTDIQESAPLVSGPKSPSLDAER